MTKKHSYECRIREIEHGIFTPLVFSTTGGMAVEVSVFYKHLASLFSNKWNTPYVDVLGWVRCCLSFSLLCSSIRCIHGSRSSKGCFGKCLSALPIDLARPNCVLVYNFIMFLCCNCLCCN